MSDVIDFETAKRNAESDGTTRIEFRRRKNPKAGYCSHTYAYIYEQDRLLECRDCGASIDPYKFLAQFAHKERRLGYTKEEIASAEKRLAELLADERRTKARLRNARKKLAAAEAK